MLGAKHRGTVQLCEDRAAILRCLRYNGPMTEREICKILGYWPRAVDIKALRSDGKIIMINRPSGTIPAIWADYRQVEKA